MHIAASVLNRISNALEEKGPLGLANNEPAPTKVQEPPIPPNADALGVGINNALETPAPAVAVPPETQGDANNGMLDASVMGGSPFNGALLGARGA
jgi:hypothetical protein